jgi:flagellin
MALSVLNNIPSLVAENQLNTTQANLQKTLYQLASGSRLNSGADDAAGLSIANSLQANITALTQSQQNANDGVGQLQVADGALSQVTTLLNRAITLATEAATGTVNVPQLAALDNEFSSIKAEIDSIGTDTTFNGTSVFTATATSIFMSDASSTAANNVVTTTTGILSSASIGTGTPVNLSGDGLDSAPAATTTLGDINSAIAAIASVRGAVGASINQLQAASNVMGTQVQNLTAAQDAITAADVASDVSNMSKYNILEQTGMAALAQANSSQQAVLKLLQ